MAPKAARGAKRVAAVPVASEKDKKQKVDGELAAVLEALAAADLPDDCREMLVSIAPEALRTPAAEREEVQVVVVKMIEKTINDHRCSLEEALTMEQENLAKIEASRGAREQRVKDCEASLTELNAGVDATKQSLAVASQAMVEKKTGLKSAEDAQRIGDAGLIEAQEYKQSLEAAIENHFEPLKVGESDMAKAKAHVAALFPVVERIPLDESLLTALPSSMPKLPGDRGMFDQMVVEQLNELMCGKVTDLGEQLAAGESSRRDRASAVEVARASHEEAMEQQKQAAEEVRKVTAAQTQAGIALEEAKASLLAFEPECKSATQSRDDKKKALDAFVTWNVSCFEIIRDKRTAEEIAAIQAAAKSAREAELEAASPAPETETSADSPHAKVTSGAADKTPNSAVRKVLETAFSPSVRIACGGQ